METKKHWTEFVEENLIEAFIAFIFLLPFLCIGIVCSYIIETTILSDIVLGLCTLGGVVILCYKLKGNE